MISHRLTHSVNVHKSSHTLSGKKKATDWTEDATVVAARIEPLTDTAGVTVLGAAASQLYRIFFEAGADVDEGDRIVWIDRTPNRVFIVKTIQRFSGFRPTLEDHIEATAARDRTQES